MENEYLETFKAEATGIKKASKVSISETDWQLQVDEPIEDGGTNQGPNPMQYFVASLVGCQSEQAEVIATELNLTIERIEIEVEVDLDLSGFMGEMDNSDGSYKEVRLDAKVFGEVAEEKIKELGEKVDARCPILGLLRASGCRIVSHWRKG